MSHYKRERFDIPIVGGGLGNIMGGIPVIGDVANITKGIGLPGLPTIPILSGSLPSLPGFSSLPGSLSLPSLPGGIGTGIIGSGMGVIGTGTDILGKVPIIGDVTKPMTGLAGGIISKGGEIAGNVPIVGKTIESATKEVGQTLGSDQKEKALRDVINMLVEKYNTSLEQLEKINDQLTAKDAEISGGEAKIKTYVSGSLEQIAAQVNAKIQEYTPIYQRNQEIINALKEKLAQVQAIVSQ